MRWRTFVVGLVLLVAVACGDDDGGDVTAGSSSEPAGTTVVPFDDGELTIEPVDDGVLAELPRPPDDFESAGAPSLAPWDGGAVLLGPAGGLVRIDADEGVEVTGTDGIEAGAEGATELSVDLLASDGEVLLAVGHVLELVADVAPARRPAVWSSEDGEDWDALDTAGLEAGSDEVRLAALTALPDGGFLAGGEIEEEDGTVLALWRSDDGEDWERLDAPGLDQPPEVDTDEHLEEIAVVGDTVLVVRESVGLDDSNLTIVRGSLDGEWEIVEEEGLDDLDLPNTDSFPGLTAVDDEFVLFGNVPVEEGDEFGERRPALFRSTDGLSWTVTELDGPTLEDPYSLQVITGTDGGAIALSTTGEGILVWRFP